MVDQEKIQNQCLSDDLEERIHALEELEDFFSIIPDKQQAWNVLLRLTNDQDSWVRAKAASTLGYVFSQMPNKQQAFKDLIKLTTNKDDNLRSSAACALCSNYFILPEKQQTFKKLIKLTNDQSRCIRAYAYHTLGKISIFNASHTEKEEDYRKELEKAITFFEAAAVESNYAKFNPAHEPNYVKFDYVKFNPAQFCLPFYRSFYSIIFKKQNSEKKIDKYLAESKAAINGSESKELLLEIVKNLAEALKEVQNLENLSLETKKKNSIFIESIVIVQ